MKKCVNVQSLRGAVCIVDWGRANLCKGLKVPLCFIPLMQILFPHYIEINYIDIKKINNLSHYKKEHKFPWEHSLTLMEKRYIFISHKAGMSSFVSKAATTWLPIHWPDNTVRVPAELNSPKWRGTSNIWNIAYRNWDSLLYWDIPHAHVSYEQMW